MEKMLIRHSPLFLVTELQRSLDFYCDVLGFERPRLWGEPPSFAMPCRDGLTIMLQQQAEGKVHHNPGAWDAYFWIGDVWTLFREFESKGAEVAYSPELRKTYGCYEFALRDPDGYLLAFGQELDEEALQAHPPRINIPFDYTIETERLLLRLPAESDLPSIFAATRYEGFNDGMLWEAPEKEEELLEPHRRLVESRQRGEAYHFTLEDKSLHTFIGRISIRKEDKAGLWSLGFFTHPEYQGQGYMSEAVAAVLSFGFKQLGAERIEACYALWNKGSEKVLKRNGMTFDRYIEKGFKKKGEWVAENLLGIDASEWWERAG